MPIYEFECEECEIRFEELVGFNAPAPPCPECGSGSPHRLLSNVSPPGRQPRGAKVRDSESRRRDREAARGERLAGAKARRAAGGSPRPGGGSS